MTKFRVFFILLVILILFNFFWLKSPVFGLILGIIWLAGPVAGVCGSKMTGESMEIEKNTYGVYIGLSVIILLSSACLHVFNFGNVAVVAIFCILSGAVVCFMAKPEDGPGIKLSVFKIRKGDRVDYALYVILFMAALVILLIGQTDAAIRSPWESVSRIFFLFYFLASAELVRIILKNNQTGDQTSELSNNANASSDNHQPSENTVNKLAVMILHFFLTVCVGVVVYKIGFGFDGFVHRAAEVKLDELGYIIPKPLFYGGQYGLVVWLAKIFTLPIEGVDKLLTPILAAIILPVAGYSGLKKFIRRPNALLLSVTLLLIIAAPLFFYSVPQALANLWLVVFALMSFGGRMNVRTQILCVAVMLSVHPLSGLAGVIMLVLNYMNFKRFKTAHKFIYASMIALMSLLVPLFFALASVVQKDFRVNFGTDNFSALIESLGRSFSYVRFISIYHLIYFIKFNAGVIGLVIIGGGVYVLFRNHRDKFKLTATALGVLTVNFVLLGFLKFDAVIDYEQGEFMSRFGQIIWLILSPTLAVGIYFLLNKISLLKGHKIILIFGVAAMMTINIYTAYPVVDAFEKNRGYSVSGADIQAAKWIDEDGENANYVVLANQSTSAAALREFGFKKYFLSQCQNDSESDVKSQLSNVNCQTLFYYPIPTSSPLYDIYLKMVYDSPKIEYINQAKKITGASTVYFVVNDYWLDAKKRIEQARQIADEEFNFEDKVWVFRFE